MDKIKQAIDELNDYHGDMTTDRCCKAIQEEADKLRNDISLLENEIKEDEEVYKENIRLREVIRKLKGK